MYDLNRFVIPVRISLGFLPHYQGRCQRMGRVHKCRAVGRNRGERIQCVFPSVERRQPNDALSLRSATFCCCVIEVTFRVETDYRAAEISEQDWE